MKPLFALSLFVMLGGCATSPVTPDSTTGEASAGTSVTIEPVPQVGDNGGADQGGARPAAYANGGLYSGPDACKLAVKGDSPVARACAEGGVRRAKIVMKDLVKRSKAAGLKFNCDDCHSHDGEASRLTPDALEKFRRLLAAAK